MLKKFNLKKTLSVTNELKFDKWIEIIWNLTLQNNQFLMNHKFLFCLIDWNFDILHGNLHRTKTVCWAEQDLKSLQRRVIRSFGLTILYPLLSKMMVRFSRGHYVDADSNSCLLMCALCIMRVSVYLFMYKKVRR